MSNQSLALPGNGTAGNITVPTPTPHNQDWSCGFWFYWDGTQSTTGSPRMAIRYNAADNTSCWSTAAYRYNAEDHLTLDIRAGVAGGPTVAVPFPYGTDRGHGTWRHLLLSNDYANGKLTAYLDNAAAYTLAYTPSDLAANTGPVLFGDIPGATNPIKGSIDCAGFWSRQLTAAEQLALQINRSYADIAANAPSLLTGLAWCLDFDGANALADRSGNGRDGTASGTVAYGAGVPAWTPGVVAAAAVTKSGKGIMVTMRDLVGKAARVAGFPQADPTISANGGAPIALSGGPGAIYLGPVVYYGLPAGTTIAPGDSVTMAATKGWVSTAAGLPDGGTAAVANGVGRPNYPVDLSGGVTMKAGGMLGALVYYDCVNPFADLLKQSGALVYGGVVVPTLNDGYPDPARWPASPGNAAYSLISTPPNFATSAAPSTILSDKGGSPNYPPGTLTLAWSSRDGVSAPDNIAIATTAGGYGTLVETTSPPYASQAGPTRHRTYTMALSSNHYSIDLAAYYYGPNIAGVSLTHSATSQGEFNKEAVRTLSSYKVIRTMFGTATLESCVGGVEHLRPDGALSYSPDSPLKQVVNALRIDAVANAGGTPFWYNYFGQTSVILQVTHDGSVPVYDRQYGIWGGSATLTFNDGATALRAGSVPGADTSGGLAAPAAPTATPSATGGVLAAGTYYYRVSAVNATGETLGSAEVSATTTGTAGSVALAWAAVSGATGYRVYRSSTPGGQAAASSLAGRVFSGAGTAYTDTGISSDVRRPAIDGLNSFLKVIDGTHFQVEYVDGLFTPFINNYGATSPMQVVPHALAPGGLSLNIGIVSLSQVYWAGTGILRGIPFGAGTRLAKACGADHWLSVPLPATDACATAIADSVFAGITPADVAGGWKAWVELSNEHWNGGIGFLYGQRGCLKWGLQDGLTADQWFARRSRQVHQIFRARATAAGLDPAVVMGVYGVQGASNGGDAGVMVHWLNTHRDDGTAVPAGDPTAIKLGANDAFAILVLSIMPYNSNPAYMARMNALGNDHIQDLAVPNLLYGYYPAAFAGLRAAVSAVYPACGYACYESGAAHLYQDPNVPYSGYSPPADAAHKAHAMVRHPDFADWKLNFFKVMQDQGVVAICNEGGIGLEQSHELRYTNPAYYDGVSFLQAVGPGDGTPGLFGVGGHDNRADFEALDVIESTGLYGTAVWNHALSGGGNVPPPPPPRDFPPVSWRHRRRRPLGRRLG